MDREALLQLLREAQEALAAGAPSTAINSRIEELTDGAYPGIMSLTLAVDPSVQAEEEFADALQAVAEVSPGRNFLEALGQGITFGGLDEIIGLINPEAGEAMRRRHQARRETNPMTTAAVELGGAAVSPAARALGAGFQALRGAGGVARTVGAGAATGGAGAGAFGFLETEGGVGERLEGAAEAAVPGAAIGAAAPLVAPVARGVGRVARGMVGPRSQTAAREAVGEAIQGAARTPEEALQFVGRGRALAEMDPSIRARAAGMVREAPNLRRIGGPVDQLRVSVSDEAIQAGKRAIFAPLEGGIVSSKPAIQALGSNVRVLDAMRKAVPGMRGRQGADINKIRELGFRQLQDVRALLKKAAQKAQRDGLPSAYQEAIDDLAYFDSTIDPVFPAWRQARRQFGELMGRKDEAGRLFASIETAVPRSVRTGLPGSIQGPFTALRNQALNVEARKEAINEIAGEAILTMGDEGVELLERLLRGGFFTRAFRSGTGRALPRGVISQTGAALGAETSPDSAGIFDGGI